MPAEGSGDPVLHLVAGPNGSGKTTLATRVLQPATHLPFVNADVIAAQRWPDARTSFITETVFSHPSKLALMEHAQQAGYRIELHVVLLPEDVTVARVHQRVRAGGHEVPEAKTRERYQRLWPLLARARDLADITYVYDNSLARTPLRLIARYEHGTPIGQPRWPAWTPNALR